MPRDETETTVKRVAGMHRTITRSVQQRMQWLAGGLAFGGSVWLLQSQ
jgi:hypothetical protein